MVMVVSDIECGKRKLSKRGRRELFDSIYCCSSGTLQRGLYGRVILESEKLHFDANVHRVIKRASRGSRGASKQIKAVSSMKIINQEMIIGIFVQRKGPFSFTGNIFFSAYMTYIDEIPCEAA